MLNFVTPCKSCCDDVTCSDTVMTSHDVVMTSRDAVMTSRDAVMTSREKSRDKYPESGDSTRIEKCRRDVTDRSLYLVSKHKTTPGLRSGDVVTC